MYVFVCSVGYMCVGLWVCGHIGYMCVGLSIKMLSVFLKMLSVFSCACLSICYLSLHLFACASVGAFVCVGVRRSECTSARLHV